MRLYFLLITLLIGGCATNPNVYIEPEKGFEGASTIEGTEIREGLLSWGKYSILKINSQNTSFWRWSSFSPIRIPPGNINFLTYSRFNTSGSTPCPCEAFGELEFNAEPDREYIFTGEVNGMYLDTWIEDKKTGKKASEISKNQYRRSAEPVSVPVFIPVK